jgi:hypothetical protein
VLNSNANQSLIVDAEKFKIPQKSQKFCPKEQGTYIYMKHHFRGFFYEGCPRIHDCREDATDQAIEDFC